METKYSKITFLFVNLLLITLIISNNANAAPYNGQKFKLKQPDGTYVEVKVYGDEYYHRVESLDGYTLIRDKSSDQICYAKLSNTKGNFISTGVKYTTQSNPILKLFKVGISTAPKYLTKHIELDPAIFKEKAQEKRILLSGNAEGQPGISPAPFNGLNGFTRRGTYVGLTLLIDFPDEPATISEEDIDAFCNGEGFEEWGNYGSVRDYYRAVSNGNLDYQNIVTAYYTAKNNKDYYTDSFVEIGTRAQELITEALEHLEEEDFDFSQLSVDEDNTICAINAFYAGEVDNAWGNGLWPHKSEMLNNFTADGVSTRFYQISNIGTSPKIRTFIHENGHMLMGWPDLYDYSYESAGVGNFCIMAFGADDKRPVPPNPYFRDCAGWEDIVDITDAPYDTEYTTTPNNNTSYVYHDDGYVYEAFYVEARKQSGWNYFLPDQGILVWHIDELGSNTYPNIAISNNYLVSLEQADGQYDLEKFWNSGDSEDAFDGLNTKEFHSNSLPNSDWRDGNESGFGFKITNPAIDNMIFKIYKPNVIYDISLIPYPNATLFHGEKITVRYKYKQFENAGIKISIDPFQNGYDLSEFTSGYISETMYDNKGEGIGEFTLNSGIVTIDQIRLQMINVNTNEVIAEEYVDALYYYRYRSRMDLTITSMQATLLDAEHMSYSITIENQGTEAVNLDEVVLKTYMSEDDSYGEYDDFPFDEFILPSITLRPLERYTGEYMNNIPMDEYAGKNYLVAMIDAFNRIDELDETNNVNSTIPKVNIIFINPGDIPKIKSIFIDPGVIN